MASVTTAPLTEPRTATPKKRTKVPQRPFRDRWLDKKGWSKRAPLLPAFIFVFLLTQLPFLITIVISLLNWKVTRPDLFGFAWFSNFVTVFTDPAIRSQLFFTVVLTLTVVLVSLLLGLGISLLLNRDFFGRGAVRTMMIAPFLIVPVAAAQLFRYLMFDVNSGLFNGLLTLVNGPQIDWLTRFPRMAVEFELIWQWTPFMTLILLAGLQSRPGDIIEAASVDGASGWQTFRWITLPHMRRYLELAGLLGAVYIIQQFDTIYVFGGIGLGAANLPYGVFNTLQNANDYGLASAQGVIVVIGSIILATLVLRNLSSLFEEETR
jgi:sorbitol/mannitol transport system permease protein